MALGEVKMSSNRYPEGVAANVRGRSYKILANVEITDADASGILFAPDTVTHMRSYLSLHGG